MASLVNVLISDKYNPEKGLQPFEASNYDGLIAKLNKFYDGETNSLDVSYAIIEALFDSHFSYDSKWFVESATCEIIRPKGSSLDPDIEFPVSYRCSQQATYDRKDIYSVATAKAKIVILSRNEIRIELFSYYVAGWRN